MLALALLAVLGLDPARYITHATATPSSGSAKGGWTQTSGATRPAVVAYPVRSIRPAAATCTPNVSCTIDSSGGTLDHIVVGADTTVQVIYPSLSPDNGEMYPPEAGLGTSADCTADSGIWILIGGTLYGPDFGNDTIHCEGTATGSVQPDVFFTPVSQSASGSGTSSDPYVVVTTVSLGATGVTLVQRITYVAGTKYFHQTVTLNSATNLTATIYHGTDIYLYGSDRGYGYYDLATGAIGGRNVVNAADQSTNCSDPQARPGSFYELEVPDPGTPAQRYDETDFDTIWSDINAGKTGTPLPDTVDTDVCEDNGVALEWDNVAAGVTIGDAMSFSLGSVVIPPTYTPTGTPTAAGTASSTPTSTATTTVSSPTATSTATATVPPVLSCALRVKPLPLPMNPTQQEQIVYTAPAGAQITTTFLANTVGGAPYPSQITVIGALANHRTLVGAYVVVGSRAGYQYTFPLDSLGHAIVTFTIPPDAAAQTVTILSSYQPSCVNTTTFRVQ